MNISKLQKQISSAQDKLERIDTEISRVLKDVVGPEATRPQQEALQRFYRFREKVEAQIAVFQFALARSIENDTKKNLAREAKGREEKFKTSLKKRKMAFKDSLEIVAAAKIMAAALKSFLNNSADVPWTHDLKGIFLDQMVLSGLGYFFPERTVPASSQVREVGFAEAMRNSLDLEDVETMQSTKGV